MKQVIPYIKIFPSYMVKYYKVENGRKADKSTLSHEYNRSCHHLDSLSEHSIKKIKKALDWIVYLAKKKTFEGPNGKTINFKLNFITLTLPDIQKHDDSSIVRTCLNNFLNVLRNKYKVVNYIWRAERQKNGNLHFHLITDKFIPWNEVRRLWNQSLELLYYITDYENKMKKFHAKGFKYRYDLNVLGWDYQRQYKAFIKGRDTHWRDPNTTDIHSVNKVGNLKIYLLKYFTKQYQNENIECMLYGMSHSLAKLDGLVREVDSEMNTLFFDDTSKVNTKFIYSEFSIIALFNVNNLLKLKYYKLYNAFRTYIRTILDSDLTLCPG